MALFPYNQSNTGSPECPCIQTPNTFDIIRCSANFTEYKPNPNIDSGTAVTKLPCIPDNYGTTCVQHDLSFHPDCVDNEINQADPSCYLKWCFVDPDKCFPSTHKYQLFPLGDDIYYSFTTCGNLSKEWQMLDLDYTEFLTVEAVIPDYEYPYHYIEEANGTIVEYTGVEYSGNGILRGVMIDYFEELKSRTDIKNITFKLPSGGSKKKFPGWLYTAAVFDVSKNLADVGGGNFYVTAERLLLSTFTIPLYQSQVILFELKKSHESWQDFSHHMKQTFEPFTANLIYLLVGIIFAVGLWNVIVSNCHRAAWHQTLRPNDFNQSRKRDRFILFSRIILESIMESFMQCFGHAAFMQKPSTLGHKILTTGFGFLILVVTASYTANLSSYLSMQKGEDYIPSMDVAIEKGITICAPIALKGNLQITYKETRFLYISNHPFLKIAHEALIDGRCDAIAAIQSDVTTTMTDICDLDLVSIRTLVLEISIAIPVKTKYATKFSRAMLQLESSGTSFIDLLSKYSYPSKCDIFPLESSSENVQLTIWDLQFPMLVLLICSFIAVCVKMNNGKSSETKGGLQELTKRDQTALPINSCDEESSYDALQNANIDLLEYKCRLELLCFRMHSTLIEINKQTRGTEEEFLLEKYE